MSDYSGYRTIVFLDSMVALEAKPLTDLPWQEIDPAGPILLLTVPQVNAEIDKRKRDGRLGKKARDFNRLIAPSTTSLAPHTIASGPPRIDIGIAACDPIKWDTWGDLDRDDPDTRVAIQVLHAKGVSDTQKVLLSHDINPLATATRLGVGTIRMPEHWLLDPEPGPAQKEISRLTARVRELEATEPELKAHLTFGISSPLRIYRVRPLSESGAARLLAHLQEQSPKERQEQFSVALGRYDYGYDTKYDRFRSRALPRHVETLHTQLEHMFGQVPFSFTLKNTGHTQAENLILTLAAVGGAIHDKFVYQTIFGPSAPGPKSTSFLAPSFPMIQQHRLMRDRHETYFAEKPGRSATIEVHCADFRHGTQWKFEGIARINPLAQTPFKIVACMSASNLHGTQSEVFDLGFEVAEAEVEELIDPFGGGWKKEILMAAMVTEALSTENFAWFELEKRDGEDDDED